jgi:hypothetical protein
MVRTRPWEVSDELREQVKGERARIEERKAFKRA